MYRDKAWVVIDAGTKESEAISRLRSKFSGPDKWSEDAFRQWTKHDFEEFYPDRFAVEVTRVLGIQDKREKRTAKDTLRAQVTEWALSEPDVSKSEFATSASEVISILRKIESSLRNSS